MRAPKKAPAISVHGIDADDPALTLYYRSAQELAKDVNGQASARHLDRPHGSSLGEWLRDGLISDSEEVSTYFGERGGAAGALARGKAHRKTSTSRKRSS